jgi:hypothetical protein
LRVAVDDQGYSTALGFQQSILEKMFKPLDAMDKKLDDPELREAIHEFKSLTALVKHGCARRRRLPWRTWTPTTGRLS